MYLDSFSSRPEKKRSWRVSSPESRSYQGFVSALSAETSLSSPVETRTPSLVYRLIWSIGRFGKTIRERIMYSLSASSDSPRELPGRRYSRSWNR